jgi:hypothetical protein
MLPLLAGRASDLLLELMKPPNGCVDASVAVRESQRAVTSRQAETNQTEYIAMGERARALGIVPDLLRPSCDDLAGMGGDGGDPVDAALKTIARLTIVQAKRLVERDARSATDQNKIVVVYGGALHNDLPPAPHAEGWSYAPALNAFVDGRFVALDLIVPEFIGDDATWSALPWIGAYDAQRLGGKTTLFRVGEQSFVLIFPLTP